MSNPSFAAATRADDREVESKVKQIRQLERNCGNSVDAINKLINAYRDAVIKEREMLHRLMDESNDRAFNQKLLSWASDVDKKDEAFKAMIIVLERHLQTPLKELRSLVPKVLELQKEREKLLQEMSRLESRVQKYSVRERTGSNVVKATYTTQDLTRVRANYKKVNKALVDGLPHLYNSRLHLVSHVMPELLESQIQLQSTLLQLSTGISAQFGQHLDMIQLQDGTGESQLHRRIAELRALSIVRSE